MFFLDTGNTYKERTTHFNFISKDVSFIYNIEQITPLIKFDEDHIFSLIYIVFAWFRKKDINIMSVVRLNLHSIVSYTILIDFKTLEVSTKY